MYLGFFLQQKGIVLKFQMSQEEIDPSIYQYDEVYEEIKAPKKTKPIQKNRQQKPEQKGSKYIGKMKTIVQKRQRDHKRAQQRRIQRENQKMGVGQGQVFVTESYLKKKQQEQRLKKMQQEEQEQQKKNSVVNNPHKMHDFRRKLLQDSER